jgi:hypothetical protein
MAGGMPATMQEGRSTAIRTVPWKPPTVSRWPLFAGIGVAIVAIIAMTVYSFNHPKETTKPTPISLPEGFQAVDKDKIVTDSSGKRFYEQIIGGSDPNMQVKFVCIPIGPKDLQEGTPDLKTYYIMVDKVTIGQFQKFAESNSIGNEWRKTKIPNKDKDKPPQDIDVNDLTKPDLPVMNVTVTEAHDFAQKMISKRAFLPLLIQWDKAGGYYDTQGREGPFIGSWDESRRENEKDGSKININRDRVDALRPVGEAKDELSVLGCRDMAGNGREWTRNVQTTPPHFVPYDEAKEKDPVRTRGMDVRQPVPLLFKDMGEAGESEWYKHRYPEIGFRVVLEMTSE